MKGSWVRYTPEELAFIERHRQLPRREAYALFVAAFGREDVSLDNFKALCTRRGWATGRDGRFDPGHIPANKGRRCAHGKGGNHPNAARTQFKPGNRPHTWRGAGHERIDGKDGYVIMIVAERNPWTGAPTRPVLKHRWLWERANGPVPAGHVLKCLDGDKTNTDPANWVAIPRAALPFLNGHRGFDYAAAPADLRPTILALARLQAARGEVKRSAGK